MPGQRLSAVACNEDVQFRTAGWPRRLSTLASSSTTSGRAWDRNPLHYDLEAAKASRFGEIVVQGGVTSAILNAVVAEKLPGPGTVFLNVNWNFIAPVRPGDAITGRVEVVEARQDKPITTLRTWVTRGDGTVVLEGCAGRSNARSCRESCRCPRVGRRAGRASRCCWVRHSAWLLH